MTHPTHSDASFAEHFGPHVSRPTGPRLDAGAVPDRAVNTHCCFCGQQCGITLLVKDEEVIGFGQVPTNGAYRDLANTNDPGGRILEFALRFNFYTGAVMYTSLKT